MTVEACVRLDVTATLLGENPIRFETWLEDGDCERAGFLAGTSVALGALVKLESASLEEEDTLWMGVVTACRKEGDRWRVTFRVEHILRNSRELLQLAARFA